MFLYKNWDHFCSELKSLDLKSITAHEATNHVNSCGKYIILKHDVETSPKKALRMALIEKKYDLRATYYVQSYLLRKKKNISILQNISRLGHEVTYHYDVLDANNGDWKKAESEFDVTIRKFEKFGFEVLTVCPHGNPVKKRNGWSSNKDFFRNNYIRNKYSRINDIVVHPEKFVNNELFYFSDAGFAWKRIMDISNNDHNHSKNDEIFALNNIIDFLTKNNVTVIVSSHPHRWVDSKIIGLLREGVFRFTRFLVKKAIVIRPVHSILNRFFYLAKKI